MDVELLDCKIRIKSDIGKFVDCWIGVDCLEKIIVLLLQSQKLFAWHSQRLGNQGKVIGIEWNGLEEVELEVG